MSSLQHHYTPSTSLRRVVLYVRDRNQELQFVYSLVLRYLVSAM